MKIIDFHSHVLPGIDDGSRSLDTTAQMLHQSWKDGVGVMIATPHFYPTHDRIDDFLERRKQALAKTETLPKEERPRILPGAEVAFFEGISKTDRLQELTIEGSDVLLLEMPFRAWGKGALKELEALSENYQVILAHVERYLKIPGNKKYVAEALQFPVHIQINSSSLLDWRRRGSLVKMFQKNQAHLLGSDSHGMNHRPPNLYEGRCVLEKKLGKEILNRIDRRGEELLFGIL